MKTFFLSIIVITCIVSCKKRDTNTCKITMAQIAESYQLTKFESVLYNTGAAQDVTSTLTNCELSGIYHFNIDGTAAYTESTNCSGSGSGTWSLSNSLYTLFTSGDGNRISSTSITSWDCTNLVLITMFPSVTYNYRFTLTKL